MSRKQPKDQEQPAWLRTARVVTLLLAFVILDLQGMCETPTTGLDARNVGASP